MPRNRGGVPTHRRKKRVFKKAKGFLGGRSKLFRTATEAVVKAGVYSRAHRRKRQGDFRRLWIQRINAAVRAEGLTYSRFICGLKQANIELNRKSLSELAINNPEALAKVISTVKTVLSA